MNSRQKQKLSRAWQDRDRNRNRRSWYRLPVPIGQPCWVLLQDNRTQGGWYVKEAAFLGMLYENGETTYFVGTCNIDEVAAHDLFSSPVAAAAEADWRNQKEGTSRGSGDIIQNPLRSNQDLIPGGKDRSI